MNEGELPPTFLGLAESGREPDVVILQIPYELTSSYGQGSEHGPAATVAASTQVELYDPLLPEDLPCGYTLRTAVPWDGEGGTLKQQLAGITAYVESNLENGAFPLALGGEHGMLPAILSALAQHPKLNGDLSALTLVQIDAHADLRSELDGDADSHACAARRALDLGIGRLLQMGIRAFCREEAEFIAADARVSTWMARDVLSICDGETAWKDWLKTLREITGPVWLTIDVDSLDPVYVPTTGTPVPGGLAFWQMVETIETIGESCGANWLGADINEIVPDENNHVSQFTAAMLATKVVATHLASKLAVGETVERNQDERNQSEEINNE
jgi:agmatinase